MSILNGVIDMHVHSAPDLIPRVGDDIDLVKGAKDAEMRAIVIKAHFEPTTFRARLVEKATNGGIKVFGGIVLNYYVGGLNPYAVDAAIKAGAKVVWMPTICAKNHLEHYGFAGYPQHKIEGGELLPFNGITIIDCKGELLREVRSILKIISESNVVLATSHCSVEESKILIREAKKAGVKKVLITHPEFEVINMSIVDQKELVSDGVYFERTILPLMPGWKTIDIAKMARIIKEVGVQHSILATDLGQVNNPLPHEGYRRFIQMLLTEGFTTSDIEIMAKSNPARLLELD